MLKKQFTFLFCVFIPMISFGQENEVDLAGSQNIIGTAVPFLNITPDSRSGSLGDAGVATDPDMFSQHHNPAKYAFIESTMGGSFSFTPWLRKLVNDINLSYLTYFYHLDKNQTLSASLRYFSLGKIFFKQTADDMPIPSEPKEYAVDLAYSRLLSDHLSGAVALRFIRSAIYDGYASQDIHLSPGNSYAADIAFYYTRQMKINSMNSQINAGVNISNIGAKLSYDDGFSEEFIPTNLKLGVACKTELDDYNDLMFTIDANKLLVPTPQKNTNTEEYIDENKNVSVVSGMFRSFTDSPDGFQEELQEFRLSSGLEYLYNKMFALRVGYHHEHENKGNRKFVTTGLGLKFNVFDLNASYIIPMQSNNPLANTVRLSLSFDLSEWR